MLLIGIQQGGVGIGNQIALHARLQNQIRDDTPRERADRRIVRRHARIHHLTGFHAQFPKLLRRADADRRRLLVTAVQHPVLGHGTLGKPNQTQNAPMPHVLHAILAAGKRGMKDGRDASASPDQAVVDQHVGRATTGRDGPGRIGETIPLQTRSTGRDQQNPESHFLRFTLHSIIEQLGPFIADHHNPILDPEEKIARQPPPD